MSTKTRNRIETEKNFNEEAVIKRLGELRKRELEVTNISKDTRLRHLKAKVRQANRRLLAISKIERQSEDSARHKAERLERKSAGLKTERDSTQKKTDKNKGKKKAEGSMSDQKEAREKD